jgi:hypothetical protein
VNQQEPDTNFEERLLTRLREVVSERGAGEVSTQTAGVEDAARGWRSGARLAMGAALALAAVVAVLLVSAGGDNPPAAFAVEPQEGGGVTIEVYSLEDASGLEQALEDAGIPAQVNWLPAGMTCREPRFEPSTVKLPGGGSLGGFNMGGPGEAMRISVGPTQGWRKRFGEHMRGEISDQEFYGSLANLNLDPAAFRPGQSVVLSGAPGPYDGDPEGGFEAQVRVAEGPVESCEPIEGRYGPRTLLTPADGRRP